MTLWRGYVPNSCCCLCSRLFPDSFRGDFLSGLCSDWLSGANPGRPSGQCRSTAPGPPAEERKGWKAGKRPHLPCSRPPDTFFPPSSSSSLQRHQLPNRLLVPRLRSLEVGSPGLVRLEYPLRSIPLIPVTMATKEAAPATPQGFALYSRFALAGAVCCSITHGALTPVDVYVCPFSQRRPYKRTPMLTRPQQRQDPHPARPQDLQPRSHRRLPPGHPE